jgi:hypothetical protein
MLVALALGAVWPDFRHYAVLLPWWLRPLAERVVIGVLAQTVFGTTPDWRSALRAWPGQCRRGWWRVLTWWRLVMPGRGLYQPIWQLEGVDRRVAARRRVVLGQQGAGRAAYWFGILCAQFELVLQLGLAGLIGLFASPPEASNPFVLLEHLKADHLWWMMVVGYGLASAVIGPYYTACCFTLYLNRRATLEAWDLELALRALKPPVGYRGAPTLTTLLLGLGLIFAAAPEVHAEECAPPPAWRDPASQRSPAANDAQAQLRAALDATFGDEDLRGYRCVPRWTRPAVPFRLPDWHGPGLPDWRLPHALPEVVRAALIAGAVGFILWLVWRYRVPLADLARTLPRRRTIARPVTGLDPRPEPLLDDVVSKAEQLWHTGAQRAALALLYRGALAWFVQQRQVSWPEGATETDCLRHVATLDGLAPRHVDVLAALTRVWIEAAYAGRLPDTERFAACCAQWRAAFAPGTAA